MPVGAEIAAALDAPLDVFVVRKLGVPQWPELAMGAIASGGHVILNEHVVGGLQIDDARLDAVIEVEIRELARREAAYRGSNVRHDVRGKTVILADDGIATGASMLAAIQAVREGDPRRVIVAVPVGSPSAYERLRAGADEVVLASTPTRFEAVGQVYADFCQVSDDEVRELLA